MSTELPSSSSSHLWFRVHSYSYKDALRKLGTKLSDLVLAWYPARLTWYISKIQVILGCTKSKIQIIAYGCTDVIRVHLLVYTTSTLT